jgi:hypothetical protein
VEYWKEIMGFTEIKEWDKINFSRHSKSAKNLLDMCDQNIKKIKQVINEVVKYCEDEGLSYTFETIVKKYPEWETGKLKTKNKADIRRRKNLEAVQKFIGSENGDEGQKRIGGDISSSQ